MPSYAPASRAEFHLSLQGPFELSQGAVPIVLPGASQRLLAFLALHDRTSKRSAIAGTLWPEASEANAHGSLRSAIARLKALSRGVIEVDFLNVRLATTVSLDIRDSRALAHRLLLIDTIPADADTIPQAVAALSSDLLPLWYDEWVLLKAEDWRQLRLHALEVLSARLAHAERFGDATAAARAAIQADPLRESAHAALFRVFLAEGNQSEALRAYENYRSLLREELGLEPTIRLSQLVRETRDTSRDNLIRTG